GAGSARHPPVAATPASSPAPTSAQSAATTTSSPGSSPPSPRLGALSVGGPPRRTGPAHAERAAYALVVATRSLTAREREILEFLLSAPGLPAPCMLLQQVPAADVDSEC